MNSAIYLAICAATLCATGYEFAINGAGPYSQIADVKVGLFVGSFVAYLLALWLITIAARRISRIKLKRTYFGAMVVGSLLSTLILLLAPLAASAAISAACKIELFCPLSANPISWSYMALAMPKSVPATFGAALLGASFFSFTIQSLAQRRKTQGHHE